jgi:flagellar basal-body rod modification protein FlgD
VDSLGNPLPSGLYSFDVENYSQGATTGSSVAETYSKISEVRIDSGETVLIMKGGAQVSAGAVTALRAP